MKQPGRAARNLFLALSLTASFANLALGVASALLFASTPGAGASVGDVLSLAPLTGILSIVALWIYRKQIDQALEGARTLIRYGGKDPDATAPAAQPVQLETAPVYAAVQ